MIRLRRRPLPGFCADPFGRHIRELTLDGGVLGIVDGPVQTIALQNLASTPVVKVGPLGASITLPFESGDITLKGARETDARRFAHAVSEAWTKSILAALDNEAARIDQLLAMSRSLFDPSRYPSADAIEPYLEEARRLDSSLLSKLSPDAFAAEVISRIAPIRAIIRDPRGEKEKATAAFIASELSRWNDFFESIESKPLTLEQRLAVVTDEDATLVLAGAGSGKTSVITAKAAYLVKSGIRKPDEILLLAFAKNAAEEMSERVQSRAGFSIEARTFHAIAYDIIGAVEGTKPALADHATDELAFSNLIKDILNDLVHRNAQVAQAIILWFSRFFIETMSEWDFKTKHEFYAHLEAKDLRTLQGEKVKSYEELLIANWLYVNGIEYQYEPLYEHAVQGTGRRDYQPDFQLTEKGIYLEHFGVRRGYSADGQEMLITAPFVDRDAYLEGMEWKRRLHAQHRTVLIETYSYERQEGQLLSKLAEKLAPHVTLKPRPPEEIYDRIIDLKQVDDFSKLIGTFLRKYKSGGYSFDHCAEKAARLDLGERARAFLDVFAPLHDEYQLRLTGRIDFEDMILRAAMHCESKAYDSPFRHILVDEFQDISQSRARLVKALKAQHADAHVFAVGDDWQSIFRFAGSDIHLMRNFGREFGGRFDGEIGVHRTVDLGRTFRSVDQIAFAARTFVLRNPSQITKQIIPAGTASQPAIRIVSVPKGEEESKLNATLKTIAISGGSGHKPVSVLLLGRYRFSEPDMKSLSRRFPQLKISFKTIHASKGLEAEHVVLLKADSGRMGFPSQIVDDPLLSLVSPEEDIYPNAEERRLMYVAMTRAKQTLTILASNARPSSFVRELREDPAYTIAAPVEAEATVHTCSECQGRLLDVTGKDGKIWYRCEHVLHCGNILPACSHCGVGLPTAGCDERDKLCACGAKHPSCPGCDQGWLVERAGIYGAFLGCVRYPTCSGKAKIPGFDTAFDRALRQYGRTERKMAFTMPSSDGATDYSSV